MEISNFLTQKTKQTADFYDNLMLGIKKRRIVGSHNRYRIQNKYQEEMLKRYFDPIVEKVFGVNKNLLDFGCANGIFSTRLAKFSKYVVGVDISKQFISQANLNKNKNLKFICINPNESLSIFKLQFQGCLILDVIHHLEEPDKQLASVFSSLKKDAKVVIFEPNIKNPAIFLMHFFDKNERGLLRFTSKKSYFKILSKYLDLEKFAYNGILIGPANRYMNLIVKFLNLNILNYLLDWLNPKVLIVGRVKK